MPSALPDAADVPWSVRGRVVLASRMETVVESVYVWPGGALAHGGVAGWQMPEQLELVWADACAPEAALDFDAPHIPTSEGIMWWLGGFAFFATLYNLAGTTNPAAKKTTVSGQASL